MTIFISCNDNKFASILSRALFKFLKTGNLNLFSNNFLFDLEISTPAFNKNP